MLRFARICRCFEINKVILGFSKIFLAFPVKSPISGGVKLSNPAHLDIFATMKNQVKFTSPAARFAFLAAFFASKASGLIVASKHDIRDEFARITQTHSQDDSAHSPEVDEIEAGAPEVVENLFDREPVGPEDGILSRTERRQLRRELRAYREERAKELCWASVEQIAVA